ncbi:MAG: hypothetical protein Q7S05_03005 [bacterium]|nr:hypothetical protein [bacterium]
MNHLRGWGKIIRSDMNIIATPRPCIGPTIKLTAATAAMRNHAAGFIAALLENYPYGRIVLVTYTYMYVKRFPKSADSILNECIPTRWR